MFMIRRIAEKYVCRQIQLGLLKKEEREVYVYGYQVLMESALFFAIAICVAILTNSLLNVVIFLSVFIPLRSFSGGWHAKSIWLCAVISGVAIWGAIILLPLIEKIPDVVSFIVEIIIATMIIGLSPVDTDCKLLNCVQKRKYKLVTSLILLMEVIIIIIDFKIGDGNVFCLVLYAHILQVISIIIEILCRHLKARKLLE